MDFFANRVLVCCLLLVVSSTNYALTRTQSKQLELLSTALVSRNNGAFGKNNNLIQINDASEIRAWNKFADDFKVFVQGATKNGILKDIATLAADVSKDLLTIIGEIYKKSISPALTDDQAIKNAVKLGIKEPEDLLKVSRLNLDNLEDQIDRQISPLMGICKSSLVTLDKQKNKIKKDEKKVFDLVENFVAYLEVALKKTSKTSLNRIKAKIAS